MYVPEVRRSFADFLRQMSEATIAYAGDWRVRYVQDHYKVYCYGVWKGNFDTAEEILEAIPPYYRDSIKKQIEKRFRPEQMVMF